MYNGLNTEGGCNLSKNIAAPLQEKFAPALWVDNIPSTECEHDEISKWRFSLLENEPFREYMFTNILL